jgi:hypothetical protein
VGQNPQCRQDKRGAAGLSTAVKTFSICRSGDRLEAPEAVGEKDGGTGWTGRFAGRGSVAGHMGHGDMDREFAHGLRAIDPGPGTTGPYTGCVFESKLAAGFRRRGGNLHARQGMGGYPLIRILPYAHFLERDPR